MITSLLPNGIEIFKDHTGALRLLTHRSSAHLLKALPKFADAFPLVPRAKWQPIDNRKVFPWLLNQGQHGSCTDHAATYVQRKTRISQGMTDAELSATWGYSFVNGGRDNGAMVSDLLPIMQQKGRCLMSQFPESLIYQSQISSTQQQACAQTAQRFRVTDAWMLDPNTAFDEAGSALQLGFFPAFAIQVGNNFEQFNGDGVAGFSRGAGNHAVHGDGMKPSSKGDWIIDMPNSWGTWGPTNNGRAFLSEAHIMEVSQDGYILRVALDDPQDTKNPPAVG